MCDRSTREEDRLLERIWGLLPYPRGCWGLLLEGEGLERPEERLLCRGRSTVSGRERAWCQWELGRVTGGVGGASEALFKNMI
jgi:hypothetical protein